MICRDSVLFSSGILKHPMAMFDYLDMCDVILSGNMSSTGLDQDHVPDEIT